MIAVSGIGRYLSEVLPRVVAALPEVRFHLLGDPSMLGERPWTRSPNITIAAFGARIYSVREQITALRVIPSRPSLVWWPWYNVPIGYSGPLLVTVHDVQHLAMPNLVHGLHRRLYARVMFALVRRRAAAVLSDSEFTTSELARYAGISPERVTITHLGVDESWFRATDAPRPHAKPYILCVGNLKASKNVTRLIDAFATVCSGLPHDLIIVGKTDGFISGDRDALKHAERLAGRVLFTGAVSDAVLRSYVVHADALAHPSLYEGFGLPPLEAMACGRPVLCSRAGSLPEVCGNAALYCDAYDTAEIARQLERIVSDQPLREELRVRGLNRARTFSWEACAEKTGRVIRNLLSGGPV
jgi:glycosyltransferase involved in cell wall biosynthesis